MKRAVISMSLASAPATTVCSVIYAHGSSQFSPEAQKRARDLLSSPQAKYLSGTGRTALQTIAGELSVPNSGGMGNVSSVTTPSASPVFSFFGEVMVNNPDQDLGTASDISTQSETAVAGFGRTVVVAFNDSGPLASPLAPFSGMGYSRSVDGGNTFTDIGTFPIPSGGANFGDPGLVVDRSGNFYASALVGLPSPTAFTQTVGIYKSTDGGLTWPTLSVVPSGTAPLSPDKPFIAVDTSTTAFSGNVYVSWTNFVPPPASPALPILFSRSTDGGKSFSAPITLSAPGEVNQGSEPAI